jgi:hypothetical protein
MEVMSLSVFGQDQLAVFGDTQPIEFAVTVNQHFFAALEQQARRNDAGRARRLPGCSGRAGDVIGWRRHELRKTSLGLIVTNNNDSHLYVKSCQGFCCDGTFGYVHSEVGNQATTVPCNRSDLCKSGLSSTATRRPAVCNTGLKYPMASGGNEAGATIFMY